MEKYSFKEAESNLKKLLKKAQNGQPIVITDEDNNHEFALSYIQSVQSKTSTRKAGSAAGLIIMSDDFDEPLSDFDEYME